VVAPVRRSDPAPHRARARPAGLVHGAAVVHAAAVVQAIGSDSRQGARQTWPALTEAAHVHRYAAAFRAREQDALEGNHPYHRPHGPGPHIPQRIGAISASSEAMSCIWATCFWALRRWYSLYWRALPTHRHLQNSGSA
jgi:hypothetical protein